MTLKKNLHFRVRFWGGGGGHQRAYAVYAFINVDNCERPLSQIVFNTFLCVYYFHRVESQLYSGNKSMKLLQKNDGVMNYKTPVFFAEFEKSDEHLSFILAPNVTFYIIMYSK